MDMSTTPRGSKIEFRAVSHLMQEADRLNAVEPGSGREVMAEAAALFVQHDYRGLIVAEQAGRKFRLLGYIQ